SRYFRRLRPSTDLACYATVVLRALLPLMLVASLAAAAELPPDPTLPARLTLKDALTIFRTHGLDLLIAEANAEAAAGDVLSANAVPNPNAAVGYYHFFFHDDVRDPNNQPLFDTHH